MVVISTEVLEALVINSAVNILHRVYLYDYLSLCSPLIVSLVNSISFNTKQL